LTNTRRLLGEAQNEERFRAVSERVHLGRAEDDGEVEFVCECGNPECGDVIACSLADYMRARRWGSRFLVVPGHEDLDAERVVERHEGWLMVDALEPVRSDEPTRREKTHDRSGGFEKLALYWAQRGDLRKAALARRRARLERQSAQVERERAERKRTG
jgi:hypothetical protein